VGRAVRSTVAAWSCAVALALSITLVLEGCGSGGSGSRQAHHGKPKPVEDFVAQASDFRNLHTMTNVRGFYIDNRLGHLDQTLAVANSPTGGEYPAGTIIQLVPQEAMVKRAKGFSSATHDWEFFFLRVSAEGTTIERRGTSDVVNRFGGNCASCHGLAQQRFDNVCERDHGCAPLPIGDDIIHAIQEADPRQR
jgi:hypothetical protein